MFSKTPVKQTMIISLIIQTLILIFTYNGFYINLNKEDTVLKEVFILEYIVQLIEACMYLWLLFAVNNFNTMTKRRYIDWIITTPIMLFTTIVYMQYNNTNSNSNIREFVNNNSDNILYISFYNFMMLLFGYLGESNILDKKISVGIGFIFFYLTFSLIYKKYVHSNIINLRIFYFVVIIWGMYGIAALLNSKLKNICYNFLDIISKNFYELYLYYIIFIKQIN